MKKFLAMLLCAMLIVPCAFAATLSEPGVLPLTSDDVTLTLGLQQNTLVTDYYDNYLTKYIEEKTGVKIEFVFFPTDGTEAKQKLSLMVAGEQKLPDILTLSLSDAEKATYGSQGFFIPLNEYLEKDAYFWNLALDTYCTEQEKADLLKYAYSPDGNIYGYPSWYCDPGDATALGMWVNKQWCENLNLAVPTTTDELYEVLKAFKENDANGNGDPNDEIPLIGHNGWRGSVWTFLMNSFVYDCFTADFGWQFNVTDGQLWLPIITEEYREGLRYIHKLYSEELISPLSFSQTQNELRAILSAPNDQPSIVGAFCGHPSPLFTATGDVDRVWEYTGVPAMVGPEGVQFSPFSGQLGAYTTYITCDCADPELAYRFLDAMGQQEIAISVRYGEQDVDWCYSNEGEVRHKYLPGYSTIYRQINPVWTDENNRIWHINWVNMLPPKLFAGVEASPYDLGDERLNANREQQMGILWYSTVPLRYFNHPAETAVKLIFTEEENDEIMDIQSSLRTYSQEWEAAFIAGEHDIDADWDAYLAGLNEIGIERYTEVAQTAYSRMN